MFGFVTANLKELSKEEQTRYGAVYCGICRRIRSNASNLARVGLSYDMAFLALLLMSLYEPEEQGGSSTCMMHPLRRRPWVDNRFVAYAADMNVALAYYQCLDDWQDDKKITARAMASVYSKFMPEITARYPRQCEAVSAGIARLNQLEAERCPNPDEPAGAFGRLMQELFVYQEDLWSADLRQMGFSLGRFIYLTDAVVDYRRDARHRQYNPLLAMDAGKDPARWEQYLMMAMGSCTAAFEKLPLVQDKALLDNILYSGVWTGLRRMQKKTAGGEA